MPKAHRSVKKTQVCSNAGFPDLAHGRIEIFPGFYNAPMMLVTLAIGKRYDSFICIYEIALM